MARWRLPRSGQLYIETTVVSYRIARPSRDLIVAAHQQITREWWDLRRAQFDLFVSRLVIREAGAGDHEAARRRPAELDPSPCSTSLKMH